MQQNGGEMEITDLYFSKIKSGEHETEDDLEMEIGMRNEIAHARFLPTNTRRHLKAIIAWLLFFLLLP